MESFVEVVGEARQRRQKADEADCSSVSVADGLGVAQIDLQLQVSGLQRHRAGALEIGWMGDVGERGRGAASVDREALERTDVGFLHLEHSQLFPSSTARFSPIFISSRLAPVSSLARRLWISRLGNRCQSSSSASPHKLLHHPQCSASLPQERALRPPLP